MIWPTNDHLSRSVSAHYPGRCRHLRLPRYGNSAWRGLEADAGWKQPTTRFFPITDENGDDLWGKLDVGSQENVLFVELITGAKPLSAFDDWIARWAEGGDLRVVEDRMNEINLKFQ